VLSLKDSKKARLGKGGLFSDYRYSEAVKLLDENT